MENNNRNNIAWIDLLRITACFIVVFAHCCDPFVANFDNNSNIFLTGVFCGSLTRPCVPLFVMLTGVLLLPLKSEERLSTFYKKRIKRIITPLIFWSLALPLMAYCYFVYINPQTANPQLADISYTQESLLQRLSTFIFNFNFDTIPLWYLYMLIGLYLIIPIFNSWLVQAKKSEIKTLLYIWGITLLLPYFKMLAPIMGYQGNYGNMELLGICDWNIYGTFYYLSGFIGYIILAYYLKTYPINWSWRKLVAICLPMFIVGYLITSVGFIKTNVLHPGNYAYLEIIWYFTGINVFMMTFPIFVTIQKLNIRPRAWMSKLASLTFGIYLCHFTFTFISYDLYDNAALPNIVRIILAAVTAFAISTAISWIMSQFKITRIFIK